MGTLQNIFHHQDWRCEALEYIERNFSLQWPCPNYIYGERSSCQPSIAGCYFPVMTLTPRWPYLSSCIISSLILGCFMCARFPWGRSVSMRASMRSCAQYAYGAIHHERSKYKIRILMPMGCSMSTYLRLVFLSSFDIAHAVF